MQKNLDIEMWKMQMLYLMIYIGIIVKGSIFGKYKMLRYFFVLNLMMFVVDI